MGWTAAGGNPWDVEAIILGSTLYLWQFPHFFALSFMHRVDYRRGGFVMVPCFDEERASRLVVRYAWYLSTIPLVATAMDVTSTMFAMEGFLLNGYALYVAKAFEDDRTNANARRVFLTSLWYLPSLLMLFLLHSKTWDTLPETNNQQQLNNNTNNNNKREDWLWNYVYNKIHEIRQVGRDLCIHEMAQQDRVNNNSTNTTTTTMPACPIQVTKQTTKDAVQTTNLIKANITEKA
eukprot:CAMPEP_0118725826 /NCGR_PEP_ID=MMETSP0800-20121206/33356_1 /TAXON_ID=210618 ORGANISM="Striatella unipunctata, Strain CCMP2910" /NCGR_SAMPLE_ID=MMETSP0800 /ASSEMBLY_ACC=CAM_ASM_000638 /LENGTH=234 /DNA_ID=CAMNT_0006634569 /DNA_START=18 /DNA_END=722 /DNA_ORIENTATION=-